MFEWSSRDAVVLVALFTHHPTSDLQNLVEIYSFKDFVFKVLGFVDFYFYFLFIKKLRHFEFSWPLKVNLAIDMHKRT